MGCVLSGALCDSIGCIRIMQLISFIWMLGTAAVVFLPYIYLVVLGRVIKGISIGLVAAIVPLYISETVPRGRKAASLSTIYSFYGLGTSIMTLAGFLLPKANLSIQPFKIVWALESVPAFCLLLLSFILPESPKWLAMHCRWSEAAKNRLRIQNYKRRKQRISTKEIEVSNHQSYVVNAYTAGDVIRICDYSDLFGKRYWKHTIVGVVAQIIVQFTCIEIIINQFLYVSKVCGVEKGHLAFLQATNYGLIALFTIFPSFLLDNCRRKDVLVFGLGFLGITYLLISSIMYFFGSPGKVSDFPFDVRVFGEAASLLLASFMFLTAIFASTVGPVSWLYTSEIFHGPARAKGTAICMGSGLAVHTGAELLFRIASKLMGPWMFFALAFLSLGGAIIVLYFPETRDLSELEVETLFEPLSTEDTYANNDDKVVEPEGVEGDIPRKEEEYIPWDKIELKRIASIIQKVKADRREHGFEQSSEELPVFSEVDMNIVQHHILETSPVQSLSEQIETVGDFPYSEREPSIHTVKESLYTSALATKANLPQPLPTMLESASSPDFEVLHDFFRKSDSDDGSDDDPNGNNEGIEVNNHREFNHHSFFHSDEDKEVEYFPIVRSKLKRGGFLNHPFELEKEIRRKKHT